MFEFIACIVILLREEVLILTHTNSLLKFTGLKPIDLVVNIK